MVFDKVKEELADITRCDADDITMETEFGTDLVIDSVDLVDLIVRLEDEFGISIEEDDVFSVKTVSDVVALVESRI